MGWGDSDSLTALELSHGLKKSNGIQSLKTYPILKKELRKFEIEGSEGKQFNNYWNILYVYRPTLMHLIGFHKEWIGGSRTEVRNF